MTVLVDRLACWQAFKPTEFQFTLLVDGTDGLGTNSYTLFSFSLLVSISMAFFRTPAIEEESLKHQEPVQTPILRTTP